MKPAPFDYHAPRQLQEAAELLASLPNAKILAGGQSLVPMMNFRYVIVDHLVDLVEKKAAEIERTQAAAAEAVPAPAK